MRTSAGFAFWILGMVTGFSERLMAQAPIIVTGWNYDVVFENDGSPTMSGLIDPSGFGLAEDGLLTPALDANNGFVPMGSLPVVGLPTDRNVTSLATNTVTGGHTAFSLQDYSSNNVALMQGTGSTVTLTLSNSERLSSLALLHTSTNGGTQTVQVTLHFEDNSLASFSYSSKDWKQEIGIPLSEDTAIERRDRIKTNSSSAPYTPTEFYYGQKKWVMYETDINLTSLGFDVKPITSVTFAKIGGFAHEYSSVFALNGSALGNRNDFTQGVDLLSSANYQLSANSSIHRLPTANSDDVVLATASGPGLTLNGADLTMGSLNVTAGTNYTIQNEGGVTSSLTLGTSSNTVSSSREDLIYLGSSAGNLTIVGSNAGKILTLNLTRTGNLDVANQNSILDISAAISGTGFSINKTGAGTMVLSGNNTFSGTTTVSAGKLDAAANGALGNTSGIVITTGGTLLLSGTDSNRINDTASMSIAGGGVLQFGDTNSADSETLGALTLSLGSILDFGPTIGNFTAAFASLSLPDTGYATIVNWNGLVGQGFGGNTDRLLFSSVPGATSTDAIRFDIGGNLYSGQFVQLNGTGLYELLPNQTLAAVPEPTTLFGGALLLSLSIFGRRRRSRRTC